MSKNQEIICATKVKFLSERMANEVIELNNLTGVQEVYKCKYCNKYHITTRNKKIKEKRDLNRKRKDSKVWDYIRCKKINKRLGNKRRKDH